MFLIMGGALAINGGQILMARLVGADASESREMTQAARALVGGTMAAGGILRGAKNLAVGGQNKYGHEVKGALPLAGKVAGGAANLAGNLLGGAAYRSGANKVKDTAGKVNNALRGVTKTYTPTGKKDDKSNLNSSGTVTTQPQSEAKQGGLFRNGVIGAMQHGIEQHKTKTPFGSHLLGSMSGNPTTVSNVTNQQSSQEYSKPADTSSVDSMLDKITVLPKDSGDGAMKPPKK